MIWYIHGTLQDIVGTDILVVPEGIGMGYLISVWGDILGTPTGSEVSIYIYHHITDQGQKLFGFSTISQRQVFVTLLSVNGLGPKGALALLGLGESNLVSAISNADEWQLTSAPGVWPKLAKKIILELSGKLTIHETDGGISMASPTADNQEIITTLAGMGYDKKAVEKILANMPVDITTLQEKTLYCIRQLSHS